MRESAFLLSFLSVINCEPCHCEEVRNIVRCISAMGCQHYATNVL